MSATKITVKEFIIMLQTFSPDAYVVAPYCDIHPRDGEGSIDGPSVFATDGYESRSGWYAKNHQQLSSDFKHPLVVISLYHNSRDDLIAEEVGA
jgi:hypothetical protein